MLLAPDVVSDYCFNLFANALSYLHPKRERSAVTVKRFSHSMTGFREGFNEHIINFTRSLQVSQSCFKGEYLRRIVVSAGSFRHFAFSELMLLSVEQYSPTSQCKQVGANILLA